MDTTAFPDGKITVDGPKSVITQIDTLVARVKTDEVLSEMKQYTVPLSALDKNGTEVDLTYCVFKQVPTGNVTLTVPIWEQRHIDIGFTLKNAPSGVDASQLLTTDPQGLEVLGPSAELDALEAQLTNIGTVDFATLSVTNNKRVFPLAIPSTVRAIESPEQVTVTMDTEGLSQKAVTLVPTIKNVIFKGDMKSLKATVPQQTLDQITLIGDETAINAISAAALSLEIDLGEAPKAGTLQYTARLIINGYDDVWAYYGDDSEGVKVYITLA